MVLQPGRVAGATPSGAVVRGLQLCGRLREEEVEGGAVGQGAAREERAGRHVLGPQEEKGAERAKDLEKTVKSNVKAFNFASIYSLNKSVQ